MGWKNIPVVGTIYRALMSFFYDVKIKRKLYFINIIITLIPVCILGMTLFLMSRDSVISAENSNLAQSTNQLTNTIDFYMEEIINKSEYIFRNTELQECLTIQYKEPADCIEAYNYTVTTLLPLIFETKLPNIRYSRFSFKYSGKIFITIYSKNDTINYFNEGVNINIDDFERLKEEPWYGEMVSHKGPYYWRPTYSTTHDSQTIKYFSLNREFKNLKTMEDVGILSIEIPEESIREVLHNYNMYSEGWSVFLLTPSGDIISYIGEDALGRKMSSFRDKMNLGGESGFFSLKEEGDLYRTYYATSAVSGWKVLTLAPEHVTMKKIKEMAITAFMISIFSFLGSLAIMMFLSKSITQRLSTLTNKVIKIGGDTSQALEPIRGSDEIGFLDHQFNEMVYKINDLINTKYKVRLEAKRIEVELLQEQINPHLLYNSLSAIRWTAKQGDMEFVSTITNRLIGFYKASLHRGDIFVQVSQEIAIADEYIALYSGVYNLQLDYKKQIDSRIYDYYCIKLLLQPILENALVHGIRAQGTSGTIEINGKIHEERIILEVRDDGIGMDEETIAELLDENVKNKKGFGLYNVEKRIKLFYGEEYGLRISSSPQRGTCVSIIIPCWEKADLQTDGRKILFSD
jgi:two-component system sensor histidine kinase YesM